MPLNLEALPDKPVKLNMADLPDKPSRLNLDDIPDKPGAVREVTQFGKGVGYGTGEGISLTGGMVDTSSQEYYNILRRDLGNKLKKEGAVFGADISGRTPEQQARINGLNKQIQYLNKLEDAKPARGLLQKTGESMKALFPPDTENPEMAFKLGAAFGSSGGPMAAGFGTAKWLQMTGASAERAAFIGSALSTVAESGMEAEGVRRDLAQQGKPDEDAKRAANETFMLNIPLLISTNKLSGIFDVDKSKNLIMKVAPAAVFEGPFQEGPQQMISNVESGRPVMENVAESSAYGAVVGGFMGGIFELANTAAEKKQTAEYQKRLEEEKQRTVDNLTNGNVEIITPEGEKLSTDGKEEEIFLKLLAEAEKKVESERQATGIAVGTPGQQVSAEELPPAISVEGKVIPLEAPQPSESILAEAQKQGKVIGIDAATKLPIIDTTQKSEAKQVEQPPIVQPEANLLGQKGVVEPKREMTATEKRLREERGGNLTAGDLETIRRAELIRKEKSIPKEQPIFDEQQKKDFEVIESLSTEWEAGGRLVEGRDKESGRKIRMPSTFPVELKNIGLTHKNMKIVFDNIRDGKPMSVSALRRASILHDWYKNINPLNEEIYKNEKDIPESEATEAIRVANQEKPINESNIGEEQGYEGRFVEEQGSPYGEDQSLIEEAKKYPTADEFVAGNGIKVYRGTTGENKKSSGTFATTNKDYADLYSTKNKNVYAYEGKRQGIKYSVEDEPSHKELEGSKVEELYFDIKKPFITDKPVTDGKIPDGYDGLVSKEINPRTGESVDVYIVKDISQIKTREKLTAIWNKAHGVGGVQEKQSAGYNNQSNVALPEEYGITENYRKAGFISPEGGLVDLSASKKELNQSHRVLASRVYPDIEPTDALNKFLNESGYVRIIANDPNEISIELRGIPTDKQLSKIEDILYDRSILLDVTGANGELNHTEQFLKFRDFKKFVIEKISAEGQSLFEKSPEYAKLTPEGEKAYGTKESRDKAFKKVKSEVESVRPKDGSQRNIHTTSPIRKDSTVLKELNKRGFVETRGLPATNSQERAEVAALFRSPLVENLQFVFVKDGSVVAHQVISSGVRNYVDISNDEQIKLIYRITRVANKLGVKEIYIAHNHPSGNETPSPEDVNFTHNIGKALGKNGINTVEHIVTDHGKYSRINHESYVIGYGNNAKAAGYKTSEFKTEKENFFETMPDVARSGQALSNIDMVADSAKNLMKEDRSLIIFVDNRNIIISADSVRNSSDINKFIKDNMAANLASTFIHVYQGNKNPISEYDMKPLDVVRLEKDGFYTTMMDKTSWKSQYKGSSRVQEQANEYEVKSEIKSKEELKPIESIELVKLAKELMGEYPTVKNLPKSHGLFKAGGKGSIKLNTELFKRGNEKQLTATLAHEIGHLVDYLPQQTMNRGNLLGRVASLRRYMQSFLPKLSSQSEESIITPKERDAIRKKVEEIIGSRPKDEGELKQWKKLRSQEYAKAITKESESRGLIELNKLRREMIDLSFEWRPFEDTGDESYLDYRTSSRELYADALSALLNNPSYLKSKAPIFYTAFFEYLDRKPEVKMAYFAAQKMINGTPEDIMAMRQQDVRTMFAKGDAIMEQLENEKELADNNIYERLRQMFDDKYYPLINKLEANNRGGAIPKSEAIHLLRKMDLTQNEVYTFTKNIDENVVSPLKEDGATQSDLSEYVFLKRIIGKTSVKDDDIIAALKSLGLEEYFGSLGIEIFATEEEAKAKRGFVVREGEVTEETLTTSWEEQVKLWKEKNSDREDLANPLGFSPETAQKQIDFLKKQIGDKAFSAIEQSANKFHDMVYEVNIGAVDSGIYSKKIFDTIITPNKNYYVTFGVLDYLDSYIPASIKEQRGTLKEVASPFVTTILKSISVIRSSVKNKAISSAINELAVMYPDEVSKTKQVIIQGVPARFVPPKGNKGQVKFLVDGKLVSYDVDQYIAASFSKDDPNMIAMGAWMNKWLGNRFFKGLVITYSPAFQVFNIQRDFKRAYINLNAIGKKVTIARLIKEYWKAIPIAKRRMMGISDATVEEMMQNKALDVPFNDYNFDERDDGFARILRKFNVIGQNTKTDTARDKIIAVAMRIDAAVRFVGNVIETLPKVAGYNILKEKGVSERDIGYITREYVGTPNYRTKGSYTKITNELFIFSNIMIQGTKADARLATRPSTRSGYWWADFKVNYFPKLLMIAATIGLAGKELKDWFDKVPEYDKTNFLIIPLGVDSEGRPRYFRVPHNETSRILSAILWKIGTAGGDKKGGALEGVFSIAGGQLPGISPTLSTIGAWGSYLAGKNPYDSFRGRYAISDQAWEASGWPRLKKMVGYTTNEIGLSQFTTYDDRRDSTFEAALKSIPFVNSVFRIIKTSDYGLTEKAMAVSLKETQESSARNYKRIELFDKELKGYTADDIGRLIESEGNIREDSVLGKKLKEITENIYKGDFDKDDVKTTNKAFIRYALKETNDPYIKAVLSSQSNDSKVKVLLEAKKALSPQRYVEIISKLSKTKMVSKDVIRGIEENSLSDTRP